MTEYPELNAVEREAAVAKLSKGIMEASVALVKLQGGTILTNVNRDINDAVTLLIEAQNIILRVCEERK